MKLYQSCIRCRFLRRDNDISTHHHRHGGPASDDHFHSFIVDDEEQKFDHCYYRAYRWQVVTGVDPDGPGISCFVWFRFCDWSATSSKIQQTNAEQYKSY